MGRSASPVRRSDTDRAAMAGQNVFHDPESQTGPVPESLRRDKVLKHMLDDGLIYSWAGVRNRNVHPVCRRIKPRFQLKMPSIGHHVGCIIDEIQESFL